MTTYTSYFLLYLSILFVCTVGAWLVARSMKLNQIKFWHILLSVVLAGLTVLAIGFIIFSKDPGIGESPGGLIVPLIAAGLSFFIFHGLLKMFSDSITMNKSFALYMVTGFIGVVGIIFCIAVLR